jgi:O-antigen ligase
MPRSQTQSESTAARTLTLVGAFSIVLIRLPTVTGHLSVATPLVLGVLVVCIAWMLPRSTPLGRQPAMLIVLAYAGLTAITVVRGSQAGVYGSLSRAMSEGASYVLVVVFAALLITSARDELERRQRLAAVALAPAVYGLANALLYIGGIQSTTAGDPNFIGLGTYQQAALLQHFGISIARVQFPLATGVTTAGVVAGAGLASCVILGRSRAIDWRLLAPLAAGCVFCLLWSDARTAIAVMALVTLFLLWNQRLAGARWISLLIPGLPIFVMAGIGVLNGPLSSVIGRSQNDVSTLDGRTHIWDTAWSVLLHPSLTQVFGWGANGHISSGLSLHYAYLFGGTTDPWRNTTHDLIIQTIFDAGYLGVGLLVWVVFVAVGGLARYAKYDNTATIPALAAVLLICCINGVTEVSPSYISQDSLIAVLVVMGAAASLPRVRQSRPIAASAVQSRPPVSLPPRAPRQRATTAH